jgi:hypothetical protein
MRQELDEVVVQQVLTVHEEEIKKDAAEVIVKKCEYQASNLLMACVFSVFIVLYVGMMMSNS